MGDDERLIEEVREMEYGSFNRSTIKVKGIGVKYLLKK